MLILAFLVAVVGSLLDPIILVGGIVIGVLCRSRAAAIVAGVVWAVCILILIEALRAGEQSGSRELPEQFALLAGQMTACVLVVWLAAEVVWMVQRRRRRG